MNLITTIRSTLALVAIGVGLAINGHAQSFLTNGLVAYYPFNGNANDASGLGKHGVVVNATLAPDRFGTPQSAFAFNGNNAVITIASNLFNVGQPEYTITAWFMSTDVNRQIQDIFDTDFHTGIAISFNNNNSPHEVDFDVGPANAFWDRLHVSGTKSDYQNGQWYHMAFTKSGTLYTLFINGSWSCEATVPAAANYNTLVHGVIGGYGTAPFSEFFKGSIDDFRVYSRALSASEVQQLYAYESAPQLTDGLMAYYPFNGNANDASGNGNNATVQGTYQFLTNGTLHLIGDGALFYSGGGYVSLPNYGNLNAGFTISIWVANETDHGNSILAEYYVWLDNNNPQNVAIGQHDAYVQDGLASVDFPLTIANYTPWKQLVLVYSPTNCAAYLNGVMVGSTNNVTISPFPMVNAAIGRHWWNGGTDSSARMTMDVKNFRIYNRALTANQVAQLYAIESPLTLNVRKAVYLDSPNLLVGTNYQVQVSSDLVNWTNFGAAFTATNSYWRTTNYWDVDNWNQLFFRLH